MCYMLIFVQIIANVDSFFEEVETLIFVGLTK